MRELYHDPKLLRGVLRRRVLRATISAVKQLARASAGGANLEPEAIHAASALARLAPQLIGKDSDKLDRPDQYADPKWWKPDALLFLERMAPYSSAQVAAAEWGRSFAFHGPQEGRYQTFEEARAYGRMRFALPRPVKVPYQHPPIVPFREDNEQDRSFEARILNEEGSS